MEKENNNRYLIEVSKKQLKALEAVCHFAWDLHIGNMTFTLIKWAMTAYRRHYKEKYGSEPEDMLSTTAKLNRLASELREIGWDKSTVILPDTVKGGEAVLEFGWDCSETKDDEFMFVCMEDDFHRAISLRPSNNRRVGKSLSIMRINHKPRHPRYLIEIDHKQLTLLSYGCEQHSRFICGQLGCTLQEAVESAWEQRYKFAHPEIKEEGSRLGIGTDEWWAMRHRVEDIIDEIRMLCWKCPRSTSYGIRYSEESDILWEMYEVFRHQLWLDRPEDKKLHCTVDAFPAMQFSDEPLVRIGRVEE